MSSAITWYKLYLHTVDDSKYKPVICISTEDDNIRFNTIFLLSLMEVNRKNGVSRQQPTASKRSKKRPSRETGLRANYGKSFLYLI